MGDGSFDKSLAEEMQPGPDLQAEQSAASGMDTEPPDSKRAASSETRRCSHSRSLKLDVASEHRPGPAVRNAHAGCRPCVYARLARIARRRHRREHRSLQPSERGHDPHSPGRRPARARARRSEAELRLHVPDPQTPYTLTRGGPDPTPFAWLTRCARSLFSRSRGASSSLRGGQHHLDRSQLATDDEWPN